MPNRNDSLQESAQRTQPDSIIIEILRLDTSPNGYLPSTLFPGAGSDGALFQVSQSSVGYPDYGTLYDALDTWDGDTALIEYDEKTGRGYFRLVDSDAPATGTVIVLNDSTQLDESYWMGDWIGMPIESKNPYADYFDPIEEQIKSMAHRAYREIFDMCERALRRIDSVTLNLNP